MLNGSTTEWVKLSFWPPQPFSWMVLGTGEFLVLYVTLVDSSRFVDDLRRVMGSAERVR